jgi:hypothetical protein
MEIHTHSHTAAPDSHRGLRKKWTHYFWEFLMLFLAVFCGFLAEYQLEHKIEKERGKEYIRSFYDDLHNNMFVFSRINDFNKQKMNALDDIYPCYDMLSKNQKTPSCFVELIKGSQIFITVAFSDGTMEQLKNAGGFRLLKKADRDSIMSYDKDIRNYRDIESTVIQQSQNNVRDNSKKLINFQANEFLYQDSINSGAETVLLFSANKDLLNEFFNDLFRYKRAIDLQSSWMIYFKGKTNGLIEYFKAKYHFD